MKNIFFALLSPIILSASLTAEEPTRASLEKKLDVFITKVFGIPLSSTLPAQTLLQKNPNLIDQYLEEFKRGIAKEIKEYIEANSKNLLGTKDTLLLQAATAMEMEAQELIKLLIPFVGTRSAKGLEELKKAVDEEEKKYNQLYLKLHGEKFTLSNKKSAQWLLVTAFALLHRAADNIKIAINNKIKNLPR